MNINFVATMIQGQRTGIFRYVKSLLTELQQQCSVTVDALADESSLFDGTFNNGNNRLAHQVRLSAAAPKRLRGLWDFIRSQFTWAPQGCDLKHVPSYRRVSFWSRIPLVVTVHDLAPLHMPEKYGMLRHFFLRHVVARGLRRVDHIVTPTQHTKDDLIRSFAIPSENISVTPNGIDHQLFQPRNQQSALTYCQRQITELPSRFVLCTGRIEHPGKGHVDLLAAWHALQQQGVQLPQLVFVGKNCERAGEVWQCAERLGVEVLHLPNVDDDVLAHLYNACELFVFPSHYEGFGLPPLEAMASGALVASTQAGALAETVGPAETFPVSDTARLASIIHRMLFMPNTEQQELRQQGIAWARQFTWQETARRTLKVYRQVLSRRQYMRQESGSSNS